MTIDTAHNALLAQRMKQYMNLTGQDRLLLLRNLRTTSIEIITANNIDNSELVESTQKMIHFYHSHINSLMQANFPSAEVAELQAKERKEAIDFNLYLTTVDKKYLGLDNP